MELLTCLQREIEVGRGIVGKLAAQQQALLELNLAELEASVPALEELAAEMRKAEERRLVVVREMAKQRQLADDASLKEVSATVLGPARQRLEKTRNELEAVLEEIYQRNHTNYMLILNAARFNRSVLQFITGTGSTYSPSGAVGETGKARSIMLNKEA